MKIIFMGTPEIAKEVLDSLYNSNNEVVAVVTKPDRINDRGNKIKYSEVKNYALEKNIPILQPEKVKNNLLLFDELKKYNADCIVVCAYGKILPKEILFMTKYGSINVHASLLPKLRGASPIQESILIGEEKTGVTIMKMGEGLDDGDMILKKEVYINRMNFEELYNELVKLGRVAIIEALELLEKGKAIFTKQDETLATFCTIIKKEDGEIDFNTKAIEIERKIRAFDPWPGAYTYLNGEVYKFWKADVTSINKGKVGEIIEVSSNSFTVNCGVGSLKVLEIQIPGKKRVTVKDFLLGHKLNVGEVFNGSK